jgi:hypothetical protein
MLVLALFLWSRQRGAEQRVVAGIIQILTASVAMSGNPHLREPASVSRASCVGRERE